MKIRNKETGLIILSTLLWITVMISGWKGQWYFGLFPGLMIMLIYMILGSAKNGVISKKLLMYPLISWFATWSIGFYMTQKYALQFQDKVADFTVLGFHPSFSFIVLLYWIGGVLTLTLGLNIFKDEWLSEQEWVDFKSKIKAIDDERNMSHKIKEEA